MFNTQHFIEDCSAALKESNVHAAVKEIVAQAVAQPAEILQALGDRS